MSSLVVDRSLDDGFEHLSVRLAHQRDGPSLSSRTGRSSNTMHVLGKLPGHVIVDDCRHALDIETSGGEIGGQEVVDLT